MGDGPILAENTTEIAVGEKDRSRAMLPHKGHFFTKMGLGAGHDDSVRSLAESLFSLKPVYTTLPRAKLTFPQKGVGLINPLCKLTPFLQLLIGRLPGLFSLKAVKRGWRKDNRATKDERTSEKNSPIDLHTKPSISFQGSFTLTVI
jgi:hypothetical protein